MVKRMRSARNVRLRMVASEKKISTKFNVASIYRRKHLSKKNSHASKNNGFSKTLEPSICIQKTWPRVRKDDNLSSLNIIPLQGRSDTTNSFEVPRRSSKKSSKGLTSISSRLDKSIIEMTVFVYDLS